MILFVTSKPSFKMCFENSNYQHCVKKVVFRGFPFQDSVIFSGGLLTG